MIPFPPKKPTEAYISDIREKFYYVPVARLTKYESEIRDISTRARCKGCKWLAVYYCNKYFVVRKNGEKCIGDEN